MKALAPALVLGVALAPAAQALEYHRVHADQSRIFFRYMQMGVPMEGSFGRLSGEISFDPAQPGAAKVSVEVDLASIDTGSSEGDAEVARKTWLDTRSFPTAQFQSDEVRALPGNRYEVAGRLTIKGTTRELAVPATFRTEGDAGVLEGRFVLRRGDFSVGEGAWSAFDVVANEVQVGFRIVATPGD